MTEHENRVSLLTLAGDGLLLVCALAGLTGSFLTLYGGDRLRQFMAMEATAMDLCAIQESDFLLLAALFALMSLSAWSLPRFRWAAVGGLALLWGLTAFTSWENVLQGGAVTVRIVTSIFSRQVSWGWVFQYDPGLTQSEEGAAVRAFLTAALALMALILGWAVVRARRWWLAALFTLPPLLPGLVADLYPSWPAFMALCACWCVMLLTDLCKWAAPDRRGVLTLAVLPCVAAVLAVITFAFPQEGYTRPDWARRLETEFYNSASRMTEFFSRFDGPFQTRVTYVGAAEEADLTHAGPLNYSGRTVLRVKSDYDGRLYLRGSSLAAYEDGVWKALPDKVFQEGNLQWKGVTPRVLFFPAMSTEHGPEHTVTVENVGAVGSCVYAPYFLAVQELEENGMSMVNDSLLARRHGWWTHTLSFVELPAPHQTVQAGEGTGTVMLTGITEGQTGGADFGRYPQFVYSYYLDVPGEYAEALAELYLARYEYVGSDLMLAAQRVANLLDELCEYDPEAPAPPEGVDPVLYFLTESRRGYCMHFASAATLMLRSLGIPARYVSGFTAESAPDKQVLVPDRAAHAWVEVWIGGFGWYPVEVTPAAAFTWYEQGAVSPEDLPSEPLPESETPEPTPTPSQGIAAPSETPGASQGGNGNSPADGFDWTVVIRIFRVFAAVIGTAALLWLGQYLPKKYRAKRLDSPDYNRAALDGYGYLLRMERWGGRMDERATELAQKARFSQHTLTREELDELRAFVDVERERLCTDLGPAARLAFRYFWGMPVRPKIGEKTEKSEENGS